MFSLNVLLRIKSDNGWVRIPVRKTAEGKFIWDNPGHGIYYLEWYEEGRRKRQTAGIRPAEVLEARRRKILELKGRAIDNGRTVHPTTTEENPVPLAATIDTYLNHLKLNQKLKTYRRYRSVLISAITLQAKSISMKSRGATFSSTAIFVRHASLLP